MDPNPKNFPILSYIMTRLPSIGPLRQPTSPTSDIEAPPSITRTTPPEPTFHDTLISRMPHLTDPKVISEMSAAVSEIAQTRSVLQALGPRPDHETIDLARSKLTDIESQLSSQLDEIELSPVPQTGTGESEKERLEREKSMYKAIVQVDEMHDAYEKLLRANEEKLQRIYDSAAAAKGKGKEVVVEEEGEEEDEEEVDEDVIRVLKEGGSVEKVDLSGKKLRILPDAFGRLKNVVVLNLSTNQLQGIPDSISGMENLEDLNLSSNTLQSLPDSIGLLLKLRILNVAGNKLTALPDSIAHCKSLEELDASFNNLGYLPTNIGFELVNLRKLLVHYNKIRSLPSSVGEMKSLQHLDAHFNELHGLPLSIGKLTALITLNLSGNFSDFKELPETFGDLASLEEVDLSNNQIHALPNSFCRLEKLRKLNLDLNPITIPPMEVVNAGAAAVKIFMAKRWADLLREEEERSRQMTQELGEAGWLKRSVSKLNNVVSSVSEYLGSPKSPVDPCLDEVR